VRQFELLPLYVSILQLVFLCEFLLLFGDGLQQEFGLQAGLILGFFILRADAEVEGLVVLFLIAFFVP